MPFWLTLSLLDGEDPVSSFRRFAVFGEGMVKLALLWALVESTSTRFGGGRVAAGIVEDERVFAEECSWDVTFLNCIGGVAS